MSDHSNEHDSVQARLQRLEEAQLYAQHDHEAVLAALEDLSQRFETLMLKLNRLESRVQETSKPWDEPRPGDGADDQSGSEPR
ncbi:MAG TPA: hypothetical protein VF777_07670 [Phycisphaerales bacterium]